MSSEPEFKSYSDDALDDMRAEQQRRWKIEDEDRKNAQAALYNKQRIAEIRIRRASEIIKGVLITLLIIGLISLVVFGIYKGAKSHYAKEARVDAAWNTSCVGAGGTLVLGDTSTDYDNMCVFVSGLSQQQYDNSNSGIANKVKDHNLWSAMCVGANGVVTDKDSSEFSYCVFSNGFSARNYEG